MLFSIFFAGIFMGCAGGLLCISLQPPQHSSGDMGRVRQLLQSLDQDPQLSAWVDEGPSHLLNFPFRYRNPAPADNTHAGVDTNQSCFSPVCDPIPTSSHQLPYVANSKGRASALHTKMSHGAAQPSTASTFSASAREFCLEKVWKMTGSISWVN